MAVVSQDRFHCIFILETPLNFHTSLTILLNTHSHQAPINLVWCGAFYGSILLHAGKQKRLQHVMLILLQILLDMSVKLALFINIIL